MRFLVFNIVVAGALFYLLTGGDIDMAKSVWNSDEAAPVRARVETVVDATTEKIDSLTAQSTKAIEEFEDRLDQAQQRAKQAVATVRDRATPVRNAIPENVTPRAPVMTDADNQPRSILPPIRESETVSVARMERAPAPGFDAQTAIDPVERKRDLARLVADMENMFADKLAR